MSKKPNALRKLDNIPLAELMDFIYSDNHKWGGYAHGDSVDSFNARKLKHAAAVFLVMAKELEKGKSILPQKDRENLFYDHVRGLFTNIELSDSNSAINMAHIQNSWKLLD